MGVEYSLETICHLKEIFLHQNTLRPLRIQRYDPGTELVYQVKGLVPAGEARVRLKVEQFVGGGYAGQVYRVRLLEVEPDEEKIAGLESGRLYALKILIPPRRFAIWYRNLIYALAFQGAFSPQSNPAAARAGALWQKLIRCGAQLRLGSERAVVDIYATFLDTTLGSYGEISEWIDGRVWRFEVDDNLEARLRWKAGESSEDLGSPEYRAKKTFMRHLVELMHDMGAYELARQYEWWTFKSQPNALKRIGNDPHPAKGLVAVDFRAGLALLPFLPMCPADFKLIFKGITRGSLVQFDRGNIEKLQRFVGKHPQYFAGIEGSVEELKEVERLYRNSLPDMTHHHLKLFWSRKLWASILTSFAESWKIRNIIDEEKSKKLHRNRFLTLVFWFLGLIPFLGIFLRRLWGHNVYRRHYKRIFTSLNYFLRAVRARIAEAMIRWHRAGRVDGKRAEKLAAHPWRYFTHLPLCILPAGMHRFFSDWRFFLKKLDDIFLRPFRLYFEAEVREKWLRELIFLGQKEGMLADVEAERINSQIKEPFIQKYLKSLAVHICTLPVTQIVSVIVAFIYIRLHPELSWQQASIHAGLILGFFQVTPISPGSIARGLYVTFLVLKERNFKDYNIAFYLSFFKYIGYLAFPIQMAYRYPDLARFMAGRWAIGMAHVAPVFGERGALLEHVLFDAFYNYPLSLRKRIRLRRRLRYGLKPRYWHVPLCALAGTAIFALVDILFFQLRGSVPRFGDIWWLVLWIPGFMAAAASFWAGGALLARRLIIGVGCGALIGLFYAALSSFEGALLVQKAGEMATAVQLMGRIALAALWRGFLFAIVSVIGVFIAETRPVKAKVITASD